MNIDDHKARIKKISRLYYTCPDYAQRKSYIDRMNESKQALQSAGETGFIAWNPVANMYQFFEF